MDKQKLGERIVEISFPIMLLLVLSAVLQGFFLYKVNGQLSAIRRETASTTKAFVDFSSTTANINDTNSQKLLQLSDALYAEEQQRAELLDKVKSYTKQVSKLTGTVETLEKITTTDPELLQKYSKIYFLNEHYTPLGLTTIEEKYDYANGKEVSIHRQVWPFLEDLLDKAKEDGVNLMVLSGYRSFAEQTTLKGTYSVQYGVGANQFSADQGYSEHQLGTTVDFTTPELGANLNGFGGTEAYQWLTRNAYRYGFALSYPENNEFYQYEPWHWRFVGKDLARDLRRKDKYFYDLEQREIDTYLGSLFDN